MKYTINCKNVSKCKHYLTEKFVPILSLWSLNLHMTYHTLYLPSCFDGCWLIRENGAAAFLYRSIKQLFKSKQPTSTSGFPGVPLEFVASTFCRNYPLPRTGSKHIQDHTFGHTICGGPDSRPPQGSEFCSPFFTDFMKWDREGPNYTLNIKHRFNIRSIYLRRATS